MKDCGVCIRDGVRPPGGHTLPASMVMSGSIHFGGGGGHREAAQEGFVAAVAHQTTHWTFVAWAAARWPPDHQPGEEEENSCRTPLERKKGKARRRRSGVTREADKSAALR